MLVFFQLNLGLIKNTLQGSKQQVTEQKQLSHLSRIDILIVIFLYAPKFNFEQGNSIKLQDFPKQMSNISWWIIQSLSLTLSNTCTFQKIVSDWPIYTAIFLCIHWQNNYSETVLFMFACIESMRNLIKHKYCIIQYSLLYKYTIV